MAILFLMLGISGLGDLESQKMSGGLPKWSIDLRSAFICFLSTLPYRLMKTRVLSVHKSDHGKRLLFIVLEIIAFGIAGFICWQMPARIVQEHPLSVLSAPWGFIAYVIGVVVFSNTRRDHDKRLSQAKAYVV